MKTMLILHTAAAADVKPMPILRTPASMDEMQLFCCAWCGQVNGAPERPPGTRFFVGQRIGPSREYLRELRDLQSKEMTRMKRAFKDFKKEVKEETEKTEESPPLQKRSRSVSSPGAAPSNSPGMEKTEPPLQQSRSVRSPGAHAAPSNSTSSGGSDGNQFAMFPTLTATAPSNSFEDLDDGFDDGQ